jgi:O-methyltransferase involved in polyketide biosynthesis
LLTSGPEGATDYVDADMHDVDKILREAAQTLDFSQPVAIMFLGVLGYAEYEEARSIVRRLLDAVPSGSYLVIDKLWFGLWTAPEAVSRSRALTAAA